MPDKRAPCRFTIQFNAADPGQQQCIDILNAQGRRKASFITNAVLQYIGGGSASSEQGKQAYDYYQIEQIVKHILEKQKEFEDSVHETPAASVPQKKPPKPDAIVVSKEDLDTDIPADMLDSISQFVSDFRK
jgi:hypothetical protein